jgi:MFS transporter, PPP family, 3-phenylpropionic acid transporter
MEMKERQLHSRLALFYFTYFLMLGAFAPYFALYLKSLGFSSFQIGALLALGPITRIVFPPLWAWAADHGWGRGRLVRIATAAATVVCAGLLLATTFSWLLAVLLVLNIFWCAALPLVEATTLGHLTGRLADYGRIRVWGSVSFVLVVATLGATLDKVGIGVLPLMLTALFGVCAASAWLLPADAGHVHHGEHVPLGRILRRPEVMALFASCFLMALAHGPYNTFYSIQLVDHGYSTTSVGWLWALGVIAEVVAFLLMPRILRRFSLPGVIGFSLACAVVRFLAVGWLVDFGWIMALAQLLHAATFGAHHAAALAVIHQLFQGRYQARGQALYTSIGFGAGGAAGGLLTGWMWDHVGPALTFTAGSAAALLALLIVATRLRLKHSAHAMA